MTAQEAIALTEQAVLTEQERRLDEARKDRESVERQKVYLRGKVPEYLTQIHAHIREVALKRETQTTWGVPHYNWNGDFLGDLLVQELVDEKYFATLSSEFVPEERSYGDSGEGMHDAYHAYYIRISWRDK